MLLSQSFLTIYIFPTRRPEALRCVWERLQLPCWEWNSHERSLSHLGFSLEVFLHPPHGSNIPNMTSWRQTSLLHRPLGGLTHTTSTCCGSEISTKINRYSSSTHGTSTVTPTESDNAQTNSTPDVRGLCQPYSRFEKALGCYSSSND